MEEKQKIDSLKKRYGRHSSHPAKRAGGMGTGPGRRMAAAGGGKPRATRETIRRLLAYLDEDKRKMGLAFFCVILNTLGTLVGAYMLRPIINTFIAPLDGRRGDPAGLFRALLVMAAVYLVGVGASYAQAKSYEVYHPGRWNA